MALDPYHPSIYTLPQEPLDFDNVPSSTLTEQTETEQVIKAVIDNTPSPYGSANGTSVHLKVPDASQEESWTVLRREEHRNFLMSTLFKLPAPYVALDASRPWLVYWTAHSLELLGMPLEHEVKAR